jgi:hypothetical protein
MKKKSRRHPLRKLLLLVTAVSFAVVLAAGLGAASVVFIFADGPGREVKLGWDASTSPNVTGYTIHYGSSSGNYSDDVFVGNETSYTLTGLEGGQTYYIAITSRVAGGKGESDFSDEIVVSIPE